MALSRTDLLSQTFTPGTGSATSSAFTPPSSSLLVVAHEAANNNTGDVRNNLTISGGGLTWTQRESRSSDEGGVGDYTTGLTIWTAPVATGASMTLTIDAGSLDLNHAALAVSAYTGYDTASPVGATAGGALHAYAAPPVAVALTLTAAPPSTSEVFAAVVANVFGSSGGVTPGSGWTEVYELGPINGWGELETQIRTGSTSTSVAWVDVNSSSGSFYGWAAAAIEVKAAAGGTFTGSASPATAVSVSPAGTLGSSGSAPRATTSTVTTAGAARGSASCATAVAVAAGGVLGLSDSASRPVTSTVTPAGAAAGAAPVAVSVAVSASGSVTTGYSGSATPVTAVDLSATGNLAAAAAAPRPISVVISPSGQVSGTTARAVSALIVADGLVFLLPPATHGIAGPGPAAAGPGASAGTYLPVGPRAAAGTATRGAYAGRGT